MKKLTLAELKAQLRALEKIRNPSHWIIMAMNKMNDEIMSFQSMNDRWYEAEKAKIELESVKNRYPKLEIDYMIKIPDKQELTDINPKFPEQKTQPLNYKPIPGLNSQPQRTEQAQDSEEEKLRREIRWR